MTTISIYRIDGGEPFNMDISPDYNLKTNELKEYIGDFYGVDSDEIKLFIRLSSNNQLLEKKDGHFFEGKINRYLFSLDPFYEPDYSESKPLKDSIDNLINYKPIALLPQENIKITFSSRKIRK